MPKAITVIFFFSLIFSSCDLFETRISQNPNISSDNFPPATTPEVLISNFLLAYRAKDENAYARCFYSSTTGTLRYIYYPASGARESYPVFSEEWGMDQEVRFFRNMISRVAEGNTINITITDSSSVNYGDSLLFTARYSVLIPEQGQSSSFTGQLEMKLVVDERLTWTIISWLDFRTGVYLTWSDMKGFYYF